MTEEQLDAARLHDAKCGPDCYLLPVALDRRLLLRYVDALRAEIASLRGTMASVASDLAPGTGPS